ncbi:MAG: TIGR00268 family protein, partial [Actinobacteria bacterium]|nr:TIGR00268 family protein [Actinomycetota bacterium]
LGLREVRVRHLGATGRVELGADDLSRATGNDRAAIERAVRGAGYSSVEIDPEPFRSGTLTRGLRSPLPIVGG